jgi:hypothetical protein
MRWLFPFDFVTRKQVRGELLEVGSPFIDPIVTQAGRGIGPFS